MSTTSRPMAAARPQWSGAATAFAAAAAAAILIHASQALFDWGSGWVAAVVSDWLYCGLFVLVAASCALRARRDEANRLAWWVAVVALLIWAAAEVVYRLL